MNFGETHWTSEESYNPTNGDVVPFTSYTYAADVMVRPGTSPSISCESNGMMAYPHAPFTANGGSSGTLWCNYD
jgi:hypothetical protein